MGILVNSWLCESRGHLRGVIKIMETAHGGKMKMKRPNREQRRALVAKGLDLAPEAPRTGDGKIDWSAVDVLIVDEDPRTYLTEPGVYNNYDEVRGVTETIEVMADGQQRVLKSGPFPGMGPVPSCAPADPSSPPPPPPPAAASASLAANVCAPFELIELALGKPYPYGVPPGGAEGNQVTITPSGVLITRFLHQPTAYEIRSQDGGFAMRLLHGQHTMMFLFRFGDGPWQDSPFSPHRLPVEFQVAPPAPGQGYGWLATIVMVDARTGLVRHVRKLALSQRFSVAILTAFNKLKSSSSDVAAHEREVVWMQRKSTSSLAGDAIDRFEQGDTKS